MKVEKPDALPRTLDEKRRLYLRLLEKRPEDLGDAEVDMMFRLSMDRGIRGLLDKAIDKARGNAA